MTARKVHAVTLTEHATGETLATETAFAINSGVTKGKATLREIARATGEPFTIVKGEASYSRENGSRALWAGDKTGRIIEITVKENAA